MELLILFILLSRDTSVVDVQLSIRIKNGDRAAFREFFERNYAGLYRFMRSRSMSHDESEDLVQTAFVMIWEKRSSIDETKSLRAFLFKIAYTRMLNHIEYQSKFKDEGSAKENVMVLDPEADADFTELIDQIKRIIISMPEKRATVFELCFMKQFTYKETADAMGVSVKTVENHMALAFKGMREALIDVYGEDILSHFQK